LAVRADERVDLGDFHVIQFLDCAADLGLGSSGLKNLARQHKQCMKMQKSKNANMKVILNLEHQYFFIVSIHLFLIETNSETNEIT